MRYRLPYRQIEQLFCDLPGMSISAGGIAKQIQRMARWLDRPAADFVRTSAI